MHTLARTTFDDTDHIHNSTIPKLNEVALHANGTTVFYASPSKAREIAAVLIAGAEELEKKEPQPVDAAVRG